MSLPPGFVEELRTRLSLGQVVGRKVMWDARKSNTAKGDLWAPCPFHQEKSASFHVDDRKGYYYCFGCHAKGDAISFVRETENVGFMEAVAILAREAGMPIPEADPQAQAKADRRTLLVEVMELATRFYQLQLQTGAGAAARDYLVRRGLSADAQARWGIGFAPDGWQNLWDALTAKGVATDLIIGAGLAKPSDKGKQPYDVFRGRIMFPIRDVRGRAIAFGGRAMDPDDNAKYLNSPETDLFDKGRTLFNHGPAREAAGKGQPLIVAEGYMDVIALVEAGFAATVAPLGTAITETQLKLLWRMATEPIIALDGDRAGLSAAMRVIDTALPLLQAGQSLRFALLPDGQDPDDLLKTQGAAVMRGLLDQAIPMVQLLWRRETEGRVFDSPERHAALEKSLDTATKGIADPSIRAHYNRALKDLRWALFQTPRKVGGGARATRPFRRDQPAWRQNVHPAASSKASALGAGAASEARLREAVILATLIATPAVITPFEAELERMTCAEADHRALRDYILRHGVIGDLRTDIATDLGKDIVDALFGQAHVAISPAVRKAGDEGVARMCLAEELAKLTARAGHARELAEAVEDLAGVADEGLTWRLSQASAALDRAARGNGDDKTEYDTGPNGARMNKDERSAFDALLGQIAFEKGGPAH